MFCDILHIKSLSIKYTVASTSAPSNLMITIPSATLTNGQVFTLDICQSMPTITAGDNPYVVINDGTNTYNLYLGMGNYVRSSNLKNRTRLVLVYGSDPAHISVIAPCLRG
jgi:hypothetical protein